MPGSNSGDEHLYYCQDANYNATGQVEDYDGEVVERYMYSPYGQPEVLHGVRDSTGTDTSADEWDPRDAADSFANEILYCGYRFDNETGLYQVRYRYYHPPLGRWLSRDPYDEAYAETMSLYEYVGSNPAGGTDASGLAWTEQECKEFFGGLSSGSWFWEAVTFQDMPGYSAYDVVAAKKVDAHNALAHAESVARTAPSKHTAKANELVVEARELLEYANCNYRLFRFMERHGCQCCPLRREMEQYNDNSFWKKGVNEVKYAAKLTFKVLKKIAKKGAGKMLPIGPLPNGPSTFGTHWEGLGSQHGRITYATASSWQIRRGNGRSGPRTNSG